MTISILIWEKNLSHFIKWKILCDSYSVFYDLLSKWISFFNARFSKTSIDVAVLPTDIYHTFKTLIATAKLWFTIKKCFSFIWSCEPNWFNSNRWFKVIDFLWIKTHRYCIWNMWVSSSIFNQFQCALQCGRKCKGLRSHKKKENKQSAKNKYAKRTFWQSKQKYQWQRQWIVEILYCCGYEKLVLHNWQRSFQTITMVYPYEP